MLAPVALLHLREQSHRGLVNARQGNEVPYVSTSHSRMRTTLHGPNGMDSRGTPDSGTSWSIRLVAQAASRSRATCSRSRGSGRPWRCQAANERIPIKVLAEMARSGKLSAAISGVNKATTAADGPAPVRLRVPLPRLVNAYFS